MCGLRIGGLASGMDIDSIVGDLMKAHRMQVDKVKQDKQIMEWQREDYRSINSSLRTFRDTVFNMKLQGTYLTRKATSADDSIVTASANTSVTEGTYTIKVKQMARGAYLTGKKLDDAVTGSSKLSDLGITDKKTLTIKVNGESVFDTDSLEIAEDETINSFVKKVNDSQSKVKVSFDENLKRLFVMTTATGGDQKLRINSTDNNALTGALGITVNSGESDYIGTGDNLSYLAGRDAQYTLNGAALTSKTNNFTVNGINLNLKSADLGKEVSITVAKDTDAVFNSIVSFINSYNDLVDKISGKLNEEHYKSYRPLTDEQLEQLSDDQIKKWEEKARSGLLRRDPILSQIETKMRMTMTAVVNVGGGYDYNKNGQLDKSDRLSQIGITTTIDYMSGKLVINEEKLREAVENDPQGVVDLFTKSSDDYNQMGIAGRLYEDVNSGMQFLSQKAGMDNDFSLVDDSFIGKALRQYDDRIEQMEDRLQKVEDRYWRQFSAMEEAINKMNSQSAWLAQQFGGGM